MKTLETVAVIPAFNEERTISWVIRAAMQAELVDGVVVVDDGSVDSTQAVALRLVNELEEGTTNKSLELVSHAENLGKSDAMRTGVEHARAMGGTALKTLVFLDADSSPIWMRDTKDNMKLWQAGLHKLFGRERDLLPAETLEGRDEAFTTLMARYIDEIVEPVKAGDEAMRTGMYQRNVVIDTILTLLDDTKRGGHAGNRAVSLSLWDSLFADCARKGISVEGWEIEAALNEYVGDQETGTFMMYSVVNVGSRVKAGGLPKGIIRMAKIHGQMPFTKKKLAK